MKKLGNRVFVCLLLAVFVWVGAILMDREKLNQELIRLHVVANSDSEKDQQIKLQVRDAIRESIQKDLAGMKDVQQAYDYIQNNLPKLQNVANAALIRAGVAPDAVVNFCREAFDVRNYDTFRLPSGVYQSLRITIGEGQGKNWWCVAFPTLCEPATAAGFEEAAVEAGFSKQLTDTLTEGDNYQIRFYFLDAVGKLEKMLFEE